MKHHDYDTAMLGLRDEWHELVTAAEAAGRWSARELAQRCTSWQLGRAGTVHVQVEPLESPVATWLYLTGRGRYQGARVITPVFVTAKELRPAPEAAEKVNSLLVRRAYASAYCSVLAEQAGVATEIVTAPILPSAPETDRAALEAPGRPTPVGEAALPVVAADQERHCSFSSPA
ncbi:hypothetical protein [Bounagaea algeriensis]